MSFNAFSMLELHFGTFCIFPAQSNVHFLKFKFCTLPPRVAMTRVVLLVCLLAILNRMVRCQSLKCQSSVSLSATVSKKKVSQNRSVSQSVSLRHATFRLSALLILRQSKRFQQMTKMNFKKIAWWFPRNLDALNTILRSRTTYDQYFGPLPALERAFLAPPMHN